MIQKSYCDSTGSWREQGWFLVLLAAAILLFWWHVWIPAPEDRMHFTDDILIKDYPTRLGLFRLLLQGHLPLWDPYQFGGWPGLANCEAGLLYPPNWVLIPFAYTPEAGFQVTQWLILLHFFVAGWGAYRLARSVGLAPMGAGFAAVAFSLCGFHCAHKKHTNMLFTLVWFPWILLQAEGWLREIKSKYLFKMTLFLALAYLAGHPQASLYITLLLVARLVYGVVENPRFHTGKRTGLTHGLFPSGGALLLALTLTCIQWIPTWELIGQGERSSADVFLRSTEFSLPPAELLTSVFPESLRRWSQTEIFYWGIIPLLLALHTLLRGEFSSFYRYLLGVMVASVLLALGGYLFAYDVSYLLFPGIGWVRAPSRWIYFASLPLALAAGREIDFLLKDFARNDRPLLQPSYWKVVGLLATVATVLFFFITFMLPLGDLDVAKQPVRLAQLRSYFYMLLFGGSGLLMLHLLDRRRIHPVFFAVVMAVTVWIDLGTHFRTLDLASGKGGYALDSEVKWLHDADWNHRTKVFFEAGGKRDLYHGSAQDFYELDGQSPLTPRLQLELREDSRLQEKTNLALYRLLGVGAILTDLPGYSPLFERVTDRLFWLRQPLERARILPQHFPVDSDIQRSLLTLQSFPYREVAMIEPSEKTSVQTMPSLPPHAIFPQSFLLASCSANSVTPAAFLVVDGNDVFSELASKSSGYCFAVAESKTGAIEEVRVFDLMKDQISAQQSMADFIDEIPDGKIVLAAVRDNAADWLLPTGLQALRSIGTSVDARGQYRLAHVIVGRKGAPIGSALEVFSATEAVVLQTDHSIYVYGSVAEKPHPQAIATSQRVDQWDAMLKKIDGKPSHPWRYDLGESVSDATGPFYFPKPVVIISSPKKAALNASPDRASIRVGGKEIAFNQRGYNLAVLEPGTFSVVENATFDLFLDFDLTAAPSYIRSSSPQNCAMRDFIHAVTDNYYILGAIRDDATDLMTPETLNTLHELGSNLEFNMQDPEARKHISHAFMAIKGSTNCVEAFARETDVMVFTRYPGGPALSRTEMNLDEVAFIPENPVEEMFSHATRPEWAAAETPGSPWSLVEDSPQRLHLSGNSENGGIVFVSELFYPGWKAYLDGLLQPIHPVDYYFRGISVPPGRHDLELVYAPVSLRLGATISLIALLAVLGWGLALLINSRR